MSNGNPNARTGFFQNGFLPTLAMLGGAPSIAEGIQQVNNQNIANAVYKMQLEQAAAQRRQMAAQYGQYMPVATEQTGPYAGQTFLPQEVLAKSADIQGNKDFGAAQLSVMHSHAPDSFGIAPAANVQQLGGDWTKRQATVQDAHATMQQLPQYATVQKPGFMSGLTPPVPNQAQPQVRDGKYNVPTLDPGTDGQAGTLSAGIQQSDWGTQSPYTMGVPNISELNTARNNEQSNANTAYANQTYRQHYQTSDATDQEELAAKKAGIGYFHQYPPVGGGSPYTGMNAQQNYLDGQVQAIDKELKTLGYVGKGGTFKDIPQNTNGFNIGPFKIPGHAQTANEQRAQYLLEMRQQLQNQLLPFGGMSFEKWKKNKR